MIKKSDKSKSSTKAAEKVVKQSSGDFPFGKINYQIMIAGMILIILGFVLMTGGGSDDPNEFNPEIFSTRRITVAPILVLIGLASQVAAIVIKAKD